MVPLVQAFLGLAVLGFFRVLYQVFSVPLKRAKVMKMTQGIPNGVEPHWFWGILKGMVKEKDQRLHFFHNGHVNAKADTVKFPPACFQSGMFITTRDPVLVQHILKDHFDVWVKNEGADRLINPFGELMGDGIFAIDHGPHAFDKGEGWLQQRKLASHIFTQHNFREFFEGVFVRNGKLLVESLKTKQTTDLQDYFFRYTMDSFGEIGFGTQFGTLQGESNAYAEAFDSAHACILPLSLEGSIKAFFINMFLPFPLNGAGVALFMKFNKTYQDFKKHCAVLDRYSGEVIAARRADPEVHLKSDLLSMFLTVRDDKGEVLSDKFLKDIILNFIIAGRDTTACTLSWTFYELARNPEVLGRLRAEIEQVLRGDDPTFPAMKDMPYLHGVIYEALRLHPPVPIDSKVAAVDDVLPDGTKVPRGTRIGFFPWSMGRNSSMWEDPEAFKPERWAKGEDIKTQFEFPVFQAGRRVCLGLAMAVFEAKTVTCMLLQNFDFKLAAEQPPVTYSRMITMSIKGGLKMELSPIS